jgi:hypothetical protein
VSRKAFQASLANVVSNEMQLIAFKSAKDSGSSDFVLRQPRLCVVDLFLTRDCVSGYVEKSSVTVRFDMFVSDALAELGNVRGGGVGTVHQGNYTRLSF